VKIAVVGSRQIDDDKLIERVVRRIFARWSDATLISGGARGVDTLAAEAALRLGHKPLVMRASWDELGLAAGPVRNRAMAEAVDAVVAVWDGRSRGTANMLCVSMELGRQLWLYIEPKREWITTYPGIRRALGFGPKREAPPLEPSPARQLALPRLSEEELNRIGNARADERSARRLALARRGRRW